MPKTANQKTRILILYRLLCRESDENHPLTVARMSGELAAHGMKANRKTIMDDLHALEDDGADIFFNRGNGGGCFLGARDFETAELKLLVDAVQASRFIPQAKSESLIRKILGLASVYDGQRLNRAVYVTDRVKSENTELLCTVDTIHTAIGNDRQISFRYYDWTVRHEQIPRHGGRRYRVSPCMLIWDNQYYYLLAFDSATASLRHYRVDKMRSAREEAGAREGAESWSAAVSDPGKYENTLFGMFRGEEISVLLSVDASLAGVIIDRFGEDVPFLSDGEDTGTFRVSVKVSISPVFLSWVIQFGGKVRILSPEWVGDQLAELASNAVSTEKTASDFNRKDAPGAGAEKGNAETV